MPTTMTITDNGASIKIQSVSQVRNIMKNQIIEVSVIKTNIIKIDIGQGALQNVFILFTEVTSPVTADAGALRDAINDMMANSVNSGTVVSSATEAKQDTQITRLESGLTKQDTEIDRLTSINNAIAALLNLAGTIDGKLFYEPMMVDESNPNIIYRGFAPIATGLANPSWAILRVTNVTGVISYQWADGNKSFDNVWQDREILAYA